MFETFITAYNLNSNLLNKIAKFPNDTKLVYKTRHNIDYDIIQQNINKLYI